MMSDDQAAVSSDVEQVSTLAAAAVSMEENENDEVITASSVESSSLPPPPLPNVAAINNPLMSYFDDDKEEGDDASNLNDSATAATNDQNLQMTNDDEEIINSNDTREIIVSLQQSIEETIPNDNEMIINEAEREGDIVGGMEVSIGQDIGSDTHSSSEIVENNNDAVDNNDSSDNHHGNIDTKIDEEVNDASSNDKTDAQNDDSTTANNIIISSPSVSPPTLPSTTKHDNKQDSNNDNDNTPTLSPGTQTLVAEAERQAAIAAAISANMSSLYNSSPSVAGNIAKVMSIGGTGDGGKSVGAPSPPVALLSGYHHHHQPTMVALPPPPPPLVGSGHNKQQQHQKQQRQRLMMKPVRFEDVRVAFDDIMNKYNNGGDNQTKGGSDAISSKVDGIHLSETNAAAVVDESTAAASPTTTTATITDVETRTEMETPLSSKTTTSTTLIPDSFLRFLLLLANVPIIIEEGEKKSPKHHHQQQQRTIVSSNNNNKGEESSSTTTSTTTTSLLLPKAAIDAAQRTYELYQLAQQTYNSISERQFLSQQDGNRDDATASFFAACSGDIVKVSAKATTATAGVVDSNGGDDEKKDSIATGVVVKEQHRDGSGSGSTRGGGGVGSRRLPTAVGVAVNSSNIGQKQGKSNNNSSSSRGGVVPPSPPPAMLATATKTTTTTAATATRSSSPSLSIPMTTTSSSAAAAVASASAVFSNVMSKVTKKQSSFSDIGKKFMSGSSSVLGGGGSSSVSGGGDRSSNSNDKKVFDHDVVKNVTIPTLQEEEEEVLMMEDYEVTIDQEMLGLTVENVLERTIIRTLLPNGAAIHAGAKIGSLIAKVGNVDTSNLTHFETIDELRQSQRPLKLTLRYISSDILRCAREEMGRLIRGRVGPSSSSSSSSATMREDEMMMEHQTRQLSLEGGGESFDSVLRDRWPSSSLSGSSSSSSLMKMSSSSAAPAVMTRAEMIQHAGKDLIRILTLLVVGMEKELLAGMRNEENDDQPFTTKHQQQHLSTKELNEAIEITSKILLEYARGHHSEIEGKQRGSSSATGAAAGRQIGSSFYPVPPGRVQGKKPKGKGKGRKAAEESPLIRIGDALQRTRFFLVETSSITATALRWEIIDYLCTVLDLDTEQELSEKEAASATGGGKASPTNDLGSAGSILKLIVVNCSTSEDITNYALLGDDSSLSLDDQSTRSGNTSHAGNAFISVVHRLAASKSTSARIAACSLGPVLWSHLDFPRQLQLRGVITRALHDVEVIVRKSTAAVLHEIAELVFDRRSVPWLVLMCERSMTDPEPQLRAAAMTLTWHLAEHLPNAFTGDANKGSLSIRRLPPRTDPTFMDVYLLQCKLLPVASNLAEDRIASVRLSVAAQCDRLVNAMGEHWFNIIIDLLQALLSDSDERVRSEATLCMPRFAESVILGTEEDQYSTVLESLMPLALKIQRDSSPLVRSSLATAAGELLIFLVGLGGASHDTPSSPLRRRENSEAPPSPRSPRREGSNSDETGYKRYKKHVDDTFIPILQNLLQDPDPEVTTASLRAVTNASRSSARSSTSTSSCSHNKFDAGDDDLASVASITSLQSHLSVDRTKPVFIPVLSEKQVLRLLPTLSNLATSAQWRVRQSAVEIVPALLGCTHRHETRHEISKLCLTLMGDKVDAVRKTAAECLCLGGSNLAMHGEDDGGEWISKIVVPHLKTCSQSEDAKQRMLSLKMIEIIITNGLCPARLDVIASGEVSPSSYSDNSEVATKESAVRSILSIAASLASDTVPNVRLNVGRVLAATVGLLDRSNAEFAASVLEKQIEEEKSRDAGSDRDVIYFAQQALSISRQHSTLSDLRRESSLMVMD